MPSLEELVHVLEVVKSTGDEAAISTVTSLNFVLVNSPKDVNSPKEEAPVEEASEDKFHEVYGKILANAKASGDAATVASVKRAYDMTPDPEEEHAEKLLKMSEVDPVLAASMAGLKSSMKKLKECS